jgi:antitoxin component of RelBE/YafQ-DinJ toxin-antitoxin module
MSTKQAFFSSVRTEPRLKKSTEHVLSELGLSWGAFVNNAAKRLIVERRVTFDAPIKLRMSPEHEAEVLQAGRKAEKGVGITGVFDNYTSLKQHLDSLKKN